jgi:hypothetical protein
MSVRAEFFKHNDKDFVRISIVGDPSIFEGRATQEHIQRFPKAWDAYRQGIAEAEPEGTPLTEVPGLTAEQARAYKAKGVRTAEELAGLSDIAAKSLGMRALTLRKAAQNLVAPGRRPQSEA